MIPWVLEQMRRRAHPIWTGAPRPQRPPSREAVNAALTNPFAMLIRQVRGIKRRARRDTHMAAGYKIRAVERRQTRRERNLGWAARGGLRRKDAA